ncbi:unnamed protein product [Ectocarpus sp. 4 AP-2014]
MSGGGTDGGPAGAQAKRKASSPKEGVSKGGVERDSKVKVPWVSWVSLAMLLLVYISNQWTRSLVYYVQNFDVATTEATAKEFMNIGLGFDETQYGLLASFSFTLLFSTCSLIAGRAVDVVSRKTATVASCLVWSAMAAGTSVANGFPTVFGLRVLQGSAQAFTVSSVGRLGVPGTTCVWTDSCCGERLLCSVHGELLDRPRAQQLACEPVGWTHFVIGSP